MITGWLKHLAGDRVEIWSAGSEPADQINPTAVQAMREVGIKAQTDTGSQGRPVWSALDDRQLTLSTRPAQPNTPRSNPAP